jgi:hypothetical protein
VARANLLLFDLIIEIQHALVSAAGYPAPPLKIRVIPRPLAGETFGLAPERHANRHTTLTALHAYLALSARSLSRADSVPIR